MKILTWLKVIYRYVCKSITFSLQTLPHIVLVVAHQPDHAGNQLQHLRHRSLAMVLLIVLLMISLVIVLWMLRRIIETMIERIVKVVIVIHIVKYFETTRLG